MKHYPSITYDIDRNIPIYAFDKLDGSNIGAEWHPKKGFWKFGTRTRLLDPNEQPLGEAVSLIKSKYEEKLSNLFPKYKWGQVVCFFEFSGPSSFAGNHEPEPHDVVLIDVNPYKKGILAPREFLTLGEYVEIPKLVYAGICNDTLIQAVRERTLPGMTFEGVVCKGVKSKQTIMFKLKSREWIARVRNVYGDNPAKLSELIDKTEINLRDTTQYRQRRFCTSCFRAGQLSPRCICGEATRDMPYEAQVPKKNAKKNRWREFFTQYYPDVDFKSVWSRE